MICPICRKPIPPPPKFICFGWDTIKYDLWKCNNKDCDYECKISRK